MRLFTSGGGFKNSVYQQKFPPLSPGPVRGRGAVMEVFKAAPLLGRDAFGFEATAGQC